MERGKRIPIHDHSGFNEGGRIAGHSIVTILGGDGGIASGGSGGGAGDPHLIVKDEGTALDTPAASLDFVGPGVIASGSGTDKTITVDPNVEDLSTGETDIDLVLAPDGAGGLVFRAEASPSADFLTKVGGEEHTIDSHGSMGASETFDLASGNVHTGTLDANCTITLTGWPAAGTRGILQAALTENGTGGYTPTFSPSPLWVGGVTPTHVTTASTLTEYVFWSDDGGTTVYGGMLGGAGATTFATPAIVLGTAAAAGAATTAIRSDSTIVAFDATVPVTQAFSDAAATGSAAVAARRDHVHGMPATPTGGAADHAHVAGETHLSDGATVTWTLDEFYEPGSVIAWNTTTIARLTVTEVLPDQATVSAAGTTGDKIVFDYAATVS